MRAERSGLILLTAAVTLCLIWIVVPFRGAIVWALAASVTFSPLFGVMKRRLGNRPSLAAGFSVLAIVLLAVVPAHLIGTALFRETAALITRNGNSAPLPATVGQLHAMLPDWLHRLLRLAGNDDVATVKRYVAGMLEGGLSSLMGGAIGIGQSAFGFAISLGAMIYLSFFFLRDGQEIWTGLIAHLPLSPPTRDRLSREVVGVLKATLRGTIIVAGVQGVTGGLIFWLLGVEAPAIWGLAMAVTSLLPPFGAGAIWLPMVLYLLLTGSLLKGVVLALCGFFIISLIDNLLRPFLIGRETHLPEYLVFLSTLGGLALMGLDGVIIGPLLVSLFLSSWRALTSELKSRPKRTQANPSTSAS